MIFRRERQDCTRQAGVFVPIVAVHEGRHQQSLESDIARGVTVRRGDGQDMERDALTEGLVIAFEDLNYVGDVSPAEDVPDAKVSDRVDEGVAQLLTTLILRVRGDGGPPDVAQVVKTIRHIFARGGHECL